MIVAIAVAPYSLLSTPKKSRSHPHIFFEADQLKPLCNMSFNLLVTPSGLGVHGGSFDIDERILMEIMF
jgi:hypothetical protein